MRLHEDMQEDLEQWQVLFDDKITKTTRNMISQDNGGNALIGPNAQTQKDNNTNETLYKKKTFTTTPHIYYTTGHVESP